MPQKAIMIIDPSVKPVIQKLRDELIKILEKSLGQDKGLSKRQGARIEAIKKELAYMGMGVVAKTIIGWESKPVASVEIFEPKANFTPDQASAWDAWWLKAIGFEDS